jgi:general secretion pathway protein I
VIADLVCVPHSPFFDFAVATLRTNGGKSPGLHCKQLQPAMNWADMPDCRLRTPDSRRQTLDSSRRGFTLLEVMVALAILGIGIVTVLELFAGSLRLGVKASRYTQATIYAQNVMGRLFVQDALDDGEESGELPGGYAWRARVQEIHPDENRSRLQPNRQSPTDLFHLKEIEVSVRWSEGNGEQNLVLRSLRTLTEQPVQ